MPREEHGVEATSDQRSFRTREVESVLNQSRREETVDGSVKMSLRYI